MSASAEGSLGWAEWAPLTGSAGDWTTTVRLPAGGFPAATMTSDSRDGAEVVSGDSSWLSAATPPGKVYGSSRDRQYVSLRPRADRPTSPSTTTYSFERPTPTAGWAFVLGDIDSGRAIVTARGPDGRLVTGAELGWQGGFSSCPAEGSRSCTDQAGDVPVWDLATSELLGDVGTAGWFRPTTPITSLTVEFYQRSGSPVYQTWFAAVARDIAGTVNLVDTTGAPRGVLPGAVLTLLGPDGAALDTATSDEAGQYIFPGYVAAPGYRVELTTLPEADDVHPSGLIAHGERVVDDVDLGATDATGVDLAVRDVRPVAVSGTVRTDDGDPVPGATVTLTPVGGGAPLTALTSSQGEYVVDRVGWDTTADRPQEYTFALSGLPGRHTTVTTPDGITVPVGEEDPSTGNDFVVRAPPSLTGTVTVGEEPVAAVVVILAGPGGTTSTTTAADGTYLFDGVPPGEHTVRVAPPGGYHADGPATREAEVVAEDLTGMDFVLSRPGAVGGTVTDSDGEPVPDATVMVADTGGQITLATDASGGYFVDALQPGDYLITLVPPDGRTAEVTERSVVVTTAGENRLEEHFSVTSLPGPRARPGPMPSTAPSPPNSRAPMSGVSPVPEPSAGPAPTTGGFAGSGGADGLAATGATVGSIGMAAAILVTLGVALVKAARKPPRPRAGPATADPGAGE